MKSEIILLYGQKLAINKNRNRKKFIDWVYNSKLLNTNIIKKYEKFYGRFKNEKQD